MGSALLESHFDGSQTVLVGLNDMSEVQRSTLSTPTSEIFRFLLSQAPVVSLLNVKIYLKKKKKNFVGEHSHHHLFPPPPNR